MDKTKDLVMNALKYYDTNNEKYSKIFDKIKYYSIIFSHKDNGIEHNKIVFYDQEKKEIFKSRYEMLGIYHLKFKLWIWAWSIAILKKNEILLSKKILNYGIDLDKDFSFLKSELITSRFKISDEMQLDIHASIASYIAKNPMICEIIHPIAKSVEYPDDPTIKLFEFREKLENDSNINFIYLLDEPSNI